VALQLGKDDVRSRDAIRYSYILISCRTIISMVIRETPRLINSAPKLFNHIYSYDIPAWTLHKNEPLTDLRLG
jgi:hypothetical protein